MKVQQKEAEKAAKAAEKAEKKAIADAEKAAEKAMKVQQKEAEKAMKAQQKAEEKAAKAAKAAKAQKAAKSQEAVSMEEQEAFLQDVAEDVASANNQIADQEHGWELLSSLLVEIDKRKEAIYEAAMKDMTGDDAVTAYRKVQIDIAQRTLCGLEMGEVDME